MTPASRIVPRLVCIEHYSHRKSSAWRHRLEGIVLGFTAAAALAFTIIGWGL